MTGADDGRRLRGSTPADAPAIFERLGIDGVACSKVVKDFGRVHIRTCVDVQVVKSGLLGRHVLRSTNHATKARIDGLLSEGTAGGFGDTEVDDFGNRLVIVQRDQHIRWLDVAVDDSLLMGMLNRLAHRQEEFESLLRRELAESPSPIF